VAVLDQGREPPVAAGPGRDMGFGHLRVCFVEADWFGV
jgi:hypothetical protein